MNVARDAIDILAEKGWHQGNLKNWETGAPCLLGALSEACDRAGHFDLASWVVASRVAAEQYPERALTNPEKHPAASFNDHPDTTLPEVIAVLEKVAVRLDEVV